VIPPGPFAPTVTQHVPGTPTEDAHHNQIPGTPTDRQVTALAEFPGNQFESDNATGDLITADRVLLVTPDVVVSEYDEWTLTDGLRYRANGAPARYVNPMTGTAVTQVNLRRIT
jgi:hypothetical protein